MPALVFFSRAPSFPALSPSPPIPGRGSIQPEEGGSGADMGQQESVDPGVVFLRLAQQVIPGLHVRLVVFHAAGGEVPYPASGGRDLGKVGADGLQLVFAGFGLFRVAELEMGGGGFDELPAPLAALVKGFPVRHRDQQFADGAVAVAVPIHVRV